MSVLPSPRKRSRLRAARLLALFALAMASPLGAQVYKWVDANGVTHYGSAPPPAGKSKEVPIKDPSARASGESGGSAYANSIKSRETEFRKRQVQREQDEVRVAEEKSKRDAECRRIRADVSDLRNVPRLFETNEKGERVYISDAKRESELARQEAELQRRCN